MSRRVLALDQGTTSTRAIVFDVEARAVGSAQIELAQHYPKPGWVEHDPAEIFRASVSVCRQAVERAGLVMADIAALGITNQRETAVVWDRATGEPVANAIVWQCRRTADYCAQLMRDGHAERIREHTGLMVDAYFSATKLRWLLDHTPDGQARAENGELCFGTVDSWLIYNLTGGRVHATDATNASRTMLFSLRDLQWDAEMLGLFDVPAAMLPEVKPSSGPFGTTEGAVLGAEIPITGVAGDQHAALYGQACLEPGMTKCTYGTGAFVLANVGEVPPEPAEGLLSTLAWQSAGVGRPHPELSARRPGSHLSGGNRPIAPSPLAGEDSELVPSEAEGSEGSPAGGRKSSPDTEVPAPARRGAPSPSPAPAEGRGHPQTGSQEDVERRTVFALEGSIFSTGATVQWLRDGLGMIQNASDTEALAASISGNEGVYLVPAFVGLGAPHWDSSPRAAVFGVTRGTEKAQLARAALESTAYQVRDVVDAMVRAQPGHFTSGQPLRADGGQTANGFLMQFQADILDRPVEVAAVDETTALGAAFLAGRSAGIWNTEAEVAGLWRPDRRFEPRMRASERERLVDGWVDALRRARMS